jgi:glycosyltransferase involved in cell wall biosynthesis
LAARDRGGLVELEGGAAQELRDAMRAPHVRRVHVTPMGVRVPPAVEAGAREHARRLARSRLRVRADARLALYAGRLSPEKHVHALVTVARRLGWLRKAHLIVAGDGPLRVDLERACRRAGPDVARFVGHLDTRALGELIAACDVFVHPNPREPFGIGPLEALAAGVPLVAPRSGGILSFARDDNAWLTGATPEDLAAGVHAALASGAERERRGAAGRAMAARFAWPAAAARMLATYDAIHQARLTGRWIDPALSSTPVRTPA